MIGTVCVLLGPISQFQKDNLHFVTGARLQLARLGPGQTQATTVAQPADLIFTLGLIKQARAPQTREDNLLATLSGMIVLQGSNLDPLFTVGGSPVLAPVVPTPTVKTQGAGRLLRLEFDDGTFAAPAFVDLPLPALDQDVRHLELRVELRIAGAVESSGDVNDVLDKAVVTTRLKVTPLSCLDTQMSDPTEHNLAFVAKLPDEDIRVATLTLDDSDLVEGQDFFQGGGVVFFRPSSKPTDPQKGRLSTQEGRTFDFELTVAQTVTERLDSLSAQLTNASQMARVAGERALQNGQSAEAAEQLSEELLAQTMHRKFRLLDSIESTCSGERDLAIFYGQVGKLPGVRADPAGDQTVA